MSKTALLALDARSGKWQASFGGKTIVSSPNKAYVISVITKGLNGKARNLGVTKIEELGGATGKMEAHSAPLIEFDINERFQFLEDYVDMVAQRQMKSAIIVGEGGLGKSFTVMSQLKKTGLKEFSVHSADFEVGSSMNEGSQANTYIVVKGYSTPKGLFRTLYENRNRLIIFDDCDEVLENSTASDLLKAALDSYDKRIVTWNAEGWGESDLPKSFEFTGAVIFISNMSMHKIPQPLISRSAPADVSMSRPEIIERMTAIVKAGEFMAEVAMDLKMKALAFVASHINNPQIKAINMRTLIMVTTNLMHKPERWERLSLSAMMAAR